MVVEVEGLVGDQAISYGPIRSMLAVLDAVGVLATATGVMSDEERNRALLDCSTRYLKFFSEDGKATRPIAFLEKYLAGRAEVEDIDLYTLLAEDKGVRKRIHAQILMFLSQTEQFHVTGIDTSSSGRFNNAKKMGVNNDPTAYLQKVREFRTEPLLLEVRQPDFQVHDWCNSIGSFELSWHVVDVRSDRRAVFVRLWGSNMYRWHPEAPRQSQAIHKAAERMKAYNAKEFEMRFRPCLISVDSGDVLRA